VDNPSHRWATNVTAVRRAWQCLEKINGEKARKVLLVLCEMESSREAGEKLQQPGEDVNKIIKSV
jgi:hypothetical protein